MKKAKRILSVIIIGIVMSVTAIPICAKESNEWNINYYPGAYGNVSNQGSIAREYYYAGGYYGYCYSIYGTNGRRLEITSRDAGGMNVIDVTTTGRTLKWKMKSVSTECVRFDVFAIGKYRCVSTGVICLNR